MLMQFVLGTHLDYDRTFPYSCSTICSLFSVSCFLPFAFFLFVIDLSTIFFDMFSISSEIRLCLSRAIENKKRDKKQKGKINSKKQETRNKKHIDRIGFRGLYV